MPSHKTKYKLTEDFIKSLSLRIKAGVSPQVASEAEGVPGDVLDLWLSYAKAKQPQKIYVKLQDAVMQATAHAVGMAEMKMREEDPKAWLLHGPGKAAGWTRPQKAPTLLLDNRSVNVTNDSQTNDLIVMLLEQLAPFPEARAAMAQALANLKAKKLSDKNVVTVEPEADE